MFCKIKWYTALYFYCTGRNIGTCCSARISVIQHCTFIVQEETEALVVLDWENGYVECSAIKNINIQEIKSKSIIHTSRALEAGH